MALISMPMFAKVPVGKQYTFVYNLRTQYRRFNVNFTEKQDSLVLNWTITLDSYKVPGSYVMSPEARKHATQLNYVMPAPIAPIVTPDNELFALLSSDALNDAKQKGECRYNNTTLKFIDETDGLVHLKDFDEGYEMWVQDDPEFPLIWKMKNNPVEIDWDVIENK